MIAIEGARPGDVISGKFRVDRVVGCGGMGVVIAAMHLQLDERVAIKVLYPQLANDAATAARFAREARAAVKIKGEHVVRMMDVGQLESGLPFLVMEYLEGRDLASVVAEAPLSLRDACTFVLQACEAIASAHALGFVHRDVKPANLFLTRRDDGSPCIKVLDFGISKVPSAVLTTTNDPLGTPTYMSPEQMMAPRNVDARTDIWALGVVLYELVSGRVPFAAETLPALSMLVADASPKPLRAVAPDLPEAFEAVVMRCLQKDPTARFENIAELARALVPFAPGATEHARRAAATLRLSGASGNIPPAVAAATAHGGASSSDARHALASTADDAAPLSSGTELDWEQSRSKSAARTRALWLVAAGVMAALGIGVIASGVRGRNTPASSEAPPVETQSIAVSAPLPGASSEPAPAVEPAAVEPQPSATHEPSARPAAKARPSVGAPAPTHAAAPPPSPPPSSTPDNPLKRRK